MPSVGVRLVIARQRIFILAVTPLLQLVLKRNRSLAIHEIGAPAAFWPQKMSSLSSDAWQKPAEASPTAGELPQLRSTALIQPDLCSPTAFHSISQLAFPGSNFGPSQRRPRQAPTTISCLDSTKPPGQVHFRCPYSRALYPNHLYCLLP